MKRIVIGEKIEYEMKGKSPDILIVSGTHGDEPGVVSSVEMAMEKYGNTLTNYFYIPKLSPSAIDLGTRKNKYGNDLNRNFVSGTNDNEAIAVMDLLKRYRFKTCFNFHEDPEDLGFYIYDAFGEKLENTTEWVKLKSEIKDLGVDLLNGIDDPGDPVLGIEFKEGLHYFPNARPGAKNDDGTLGTWLGLENLVEKYLNFEIPGKAFQETKDSLVDAIFRHLIIK